MTVGVDEPRHHDVTARVDHLRVAGIEMRSDCGDAITLHQHVADRKVLQLRVHGEHVAAPNQDALSHPTSPHAVARHTASILNPSRSRTNAP